MINLVAIAGRFGLQVYSCCIYYRDCIEIELSIELRLEAIVC